MKTEKRLTMALSVLVALMMLAVPLASSSNLFVDGGQTNSNGDAPLSAESTPSPSYRVDFILNEGSDGRISLDKTTYNLPTNSEGISWYSDENNNIFAIVDSSKNVTIQQLIWALTLNPNTDNAKFIMDKTGYILDSFINNDNSSAFGPDKLNTSAPASGDKITKNMTLTAKWLLDERYAQLDVDVLIDGETKEYVKVFPKFEGTYNEGKTVIDEKNVYILVGEDSFIHTGIDDIDTYGIIVNASASEKKIDEVYTFKTTYGDNKEISSEISAIPVKVPITSKLTMTYTFDDKKFSKIDVNSIAFNKEIFKDGMVTLYASKLRAYTYVQVYNALADQTLKDTEEKLTYDVPILTVDAEFVTADGYKLTGWNGEDELLQSEKEASSPLTLDAELNGYYVIFMSKGQFEYVYVPFGELSADKTTLDIAGVNHWVYILYDKYSAEKGFAAADIKSFNFASSSDKSAVELKDKDKTPTAVLIACFTPSSSTSYAVFDASSYTYKNGSKANESAAVDPDQTIKGTFGNEYVQYLIIPGKSGDKISVPSIKPVYDEDSKVLFISWNKYPAVTGEKTVTVPVGGGSKTEYLPVEAAYSEKDVYGKDIARYSANAVGYNHTITFYDGSEVVGTFYYSTVPTVSITTGLVAFEIDGKAYKAIYDDKSKLTLGEEAGKAYNSILVPDKDGYYITQWNDADKNKVITIEKGVVTKTDVKDMKDDLNLYAQFKAEKYDIVYTNTYGNVGSMSQTASVDETVKLYSDSTFVYDGYKLTGWSDRPDGNGTNYDLGASFTLNGEQYEDLKDGKFTLYAVWEKLGSGSGTGGNTGGDNDNTALYLIAGMLAVIAILAIVGILLMRRK